MNKLEMAQKIATVATLVTVVGFLLTSVGVGLGTVLFSIGMMGGLVSYFYGGFKKACAISLKIAKFGWFVVPFPYDIMTFFVSFMISIMVFLFLPIIPVRLAYKDSLKQV